MEGPPLLELKINQNI